MGFQQNFLLPGKQHSECQFGGIPSNFYSACWGNVQTSNEILSCLNQFSFTPNPLLLKPCKPCGYVKISHFLSSGQCPQNVPELCALHYFYKKLMNGANENL